MLPIEETSATAEPVTPPKNIEATTTICARLPGSQPTSTSAMRTSRIATPPRAISVPAKTKKITASSGNVFSDVSMRCTIVALSTPGSSSVATTEAMPSEQRIDDVLEREQQEQGARDRHRDVVPVIRIWNRLHHVGSEIFHEHDAVAEDDPPEAEDQDADRRTQPAADRRGQRVEQDVEADMLVPRYARGGAQEGNPDQQVARHFLGPGQRAAEHVAADHRQHDDEEERGGLNDARRPDAGQRPGDCPV